MEGLNLRIIDANLNRLREGLRVLEDIFRYIHDDFKTASTIKNLRHKTKLDIHKELLSSRDALNDVLKPTTSSEAKRDDLNSVMIANFKRTQESARVLEEILKLSDSKKAEEFKALRYELYELEKNLI
ncbi:MAG: thiamine-phosphate pyrophosphorylase [Sulfurospirillaceae bacterium]